MSIRNSLLKVLKEYTKAQNEEFTKHPLANFIRQNLPETISAASNEADRFVFKGSAGQGNWARGPWVAIFNPIITTSAQVGFYPVYLFREDMAGVYLSLNQAMTEQKNLYKADAKTVLAAKSENYRAILGSSTGRFKGQAIDLSPSSRTNDTAFYEAGNILSVYYAADKIPNDEILQSDLNEVLELYDLLIHGDSATQAENQIEGDEPDSSSFEDATKLRIHKRIERNQKLAKAAKEYHGYTCQACGMNFEKVYGEIGKGYIEAHHLEPVSSLKGKKVSRDPTKDFAVLCANCHRMIHKSKFVGNVLLFKEKFLRL
jgi:5-methylcytosine-specific restriction protein A